MVRNLILSWPHLPDPVADWNATDCSSFPFQARDGRTVWQSYDGSFRVLRVSVHSELVRLVDHLRELPREVTRAGLLLLTPKFHYVESSRLGIC